MTKKENDQNLEILLHEHKIINKKIDDFINSQFIYITTLITLSAGFLYFVYNNKLGVNIYLLPYLLFIIGPTFLYKFNRTLILHGYRHYIEEKINIISKKNLLIGALLTKDKLLMKNYFSLFNGIVLFGILISLIIYCNWNIINSCSNLIYHFIVQLIFIAISILLFLYNNSAFKKGYSYANELYKKSEIINCKNQQE